MNKNVWFSVDVDAMAEAAGHKAIPILIDLLDCSHKSQLPIGGQTRISPPNNHLNYIFTWYSLTIALAYMTRQIFLRKPPTPPRVIIKR